MQETLFRAWRNPAVLEQAGGSARGWLFTVAERIAIDQWRAANRRPELVTDRVPERAVDDSTEQAVDRNLVLNALRTLSTDHRRVLFECYFRGASVAEAAEHPWRATRHHQVPHPLRPARATTSNRRPRQHPVQPSTRSSPRASGCARCVVLTVALQSHSQQVGHPNGKVHSRRLTMSTTLAS